MKSIVLVAMGLLGMGLGQGRMAFFLSRAIFEAALLNLGRPSLELCLQMKTFIERSDRGFMVRRCQPLI